MAISKNIIDRLYKSAADDGSRFLTIDELTKIERIPTVSPSVNYMLQGGLVPSKFYGFAGPPSGGKSMFAVSCCAELLRKDKDAVILWFDVERSFTKHWLDIYLPEMDKEELSQRFIVKECISGEQIFDWFATEVKDLMDNGLKVAACVVDSVQSITPPAEERAENSEKIVMAAMAQYLPRAMKRIIPVSRDKEVTWFFICQVRDNMDMFTSMSQKYVVPGGNAFHHFIDGLLMFEPVNRKDMKIFAEEKGMGGKDVQIGHHVQVKMQNKCRVGVPNRIARFKFLYSSGIVDTHLEIIELALNKKLIVNKGANYYNGWGAGDIKLGNGRADLEATIAKDVEIQNTLWEKISEAM